MRDEARSPRSIVRRRTRTRRLERLHHPRRRGRQHLAALRALTLRAALVLFERGLRLRRRWQGIRSENGLVVHRANGKRDTERRNALGVPHKRRQKGALQRRERRRIAPRGPFTRSSDDVRAAASAASSSTPGAAGALGRSARVHLWGVVETVRTSTRAAEAAGSREGKRACRSWGRPPSHNFVVTASPERGRHVSTHFPPADFHRDACSSLSDPGAPISRKRSSTRRRLLR
jgi:hypothetical protein